MNNYLCYLFRFSETEKGLFEKMYRDYVAELGEYSHRIKSNPITVTEINHILNNEALMKFFITNSAKEIVGFCLVGFGENTHAETDYYIAEFYILPEYRRSGFATAAVKKLLSMFPGKYCYHVLKENIIARYFWDHIQKECCCTPLSLEDTCGLKDCDFFGFERGK